jgi:glycosyltransferase involved in cell wall biosynthesis
MPPRVSVIIPTFNAQEYLAAAIESVRGQSFEDWELIVYDDGSFDHTLQIGRQYARSDPRIRVVEGAHGGTASARNGGASLTNRGAEFIIFLDNDDVWEPDALLLLTRALDDHPDSPAAHGLARAIDALGRRFPGDHLPESMSRRRAMRDGMMIDLPSGAPTTFEALLVENYPVTPGTTLVRSSVWQAVGGFVPATVPCDDWDMNLRVARRGEIALVDRVVLNWRRHSGVASNTTRRWRQAYLLVRRRAVASRENSRQQRAAAEAAFRFTCGDARRQIVREAGRRDPVAFARAVVRWALFTAAYWRTLGSGPD